MYRNSFLAPAIAICCIFSPKFDANAADWTQWGRTNNRNMISQETNLPSDFQTNTRSSDPPAKNIKWTARLGAYAYGNPTVANGKVFVGTDAQTLSADPRFKFTKGGLLKCFAEDSGQLLWQLPVPVRTGLPPGALFTHQHLGGYRRLLDLVFDDLGSPAQFSLPNLALLVDLLDRLDRSLGGRDRQIPGDEVIAAEAVFHVDRLPGRADLRYVFAEYDFHLFHSPLYIHLRWFNTLVNCNFPAPVVPAIDQPDQGKREISDQARR